MFAFKMVKGEIIILIKNGLVDPSSKPRRGCFVFLTVLLLFGVEFFKLVMVTSLDKGILIRWNWVQNWYCK